MNRTPLLHENATAHHLALLRIMVFGLWMADVVKDPITELARIPFSDFHPVGVLRLLPMSFWNAVHTEHALRLWWAVLLVFLALSALGTPLYRVIAGITCILLTFYQGMIFGFSHVTHAELVAIYMTYILAVFPSADALSVRRPRARWIPKPIYQAALLTTTIVLLSTYMFTGVRRIFVGGIDIFINGTILTMIADGSATPDHLQQSVGLWVLESPARAVVLEIGFVIITLFEILSLLCLSSKGFRRSWLIVILTFSLLSWPLLQTLFLYNILLIGVLLIDWDGIARGWLVGRWFETVRNGSAILAEND